eukprot:1553-Karenia_brevis.AAC.1
MDVTRLGWAYSVPFHSKCNLGAYFFLLSFIDVSLGAPGFSLSQVQFRMSLGLGLWALSFPSAI